MYSECSDAELLLDSYGRKQSLARIAAVETLPGWGYPYDSLLVDLQRWQNSPFVIVDSIGASFEGRAIWHLSIKDTLSALTPKRVTMHNRTHPLEVQSWWVQKEMIEFLISNDSLAEAMRKEIQFEMIPMINPDGVEAMADCPAGFGRCNANEIDLEREWGSLAPQSEVLAVRNLFEGFMNSIQPIAVALNMHSAFGCERYFWYHDASGTSENFAKKERVFIEDIHLEWPEGILNWPSKVSWVGGGPDYFPESWFWLQYSESVMALTYEDVKNCNAEEREWNRQATAILRGISKYLKRTEEEILPLYPRSLALPSKTMPFNILGQRDLRTACRVKSIEGPCK